MATTAPQKLTSKEIKVWIPKTKFFEVRMDCIVRAADRRDLPHAAYTAAYGIAWAIETSRVSAQVAQAIKSLGDAKLATLVARVGNECATINDVPRWLNQKLAA